MKKLTSLTFACATLAAAAAYAQPPQGKVYQKGGTGSAFGTTLQLNWLEMPLSDGAIYSVAWTRDGFGLDFLYYFESLDCSGHAYYAFYWDSWNGPPTARWDGANFYTAEGGTQENPTFVNKYIRSWSYPYGTQIACGNAGGNGFVAYVTEPKPLGSGNVVPPFVVK